MSAAVQGRAAGERALPFDAVTQRLAVVWVAVTATGLWLSQLGLHALHVWDALTAERTLSPLRDWTLCMQWWAVSVLAALVLYVLQVPKLRFDVRQLVVVIIVATVVQSSLLLPASPVSVRALTERAFNWVYAMDSVAHVIGVSGELDMGALATGAADVDAVDHIEDGSMTVSMFGSHIEGSLTVNIIPYSSAELNPDGRDYCVRLRRASALDVTPTSQAVRIPVLLVGIPPWTLEYAFVDFRTGEETVRTVNVAYEDTAGGSRAAVEDNDFYVHFAKQYGLNAGGDSSDQREEAKRKYIYIETDTPGSFHLRSLQDVKGPGAVSKSIVNVSVCPEAYWKRSDPSADAITADATINEKIKPTQRSICRDERASVSAFAYGSPPLTVTYFRKVGGRQPTNITVTNVDEQYAYSAVRSLHTASAFVVDIDLGEFEKAQNYEYFITKVIDGDGHYTEYTEMVDSDNTSFDVLERPTAKLACDPNTDIEVVVDDSDPLRAKSGKTIEVQIRGREPPFDITYTVQRADGELIKKEVKGVGASVFRIPVDFIGTYRLASVSDASCAGTVDVNTCGLTILTPPTVDIRSKAIETPCFGQIGLSFDLSLTGVGPWTVWYDLVYQKAKPQRKSVLLTKPTDHIQIKPTNPGVYTVTFVQVQDSRYPDPVPIQGVSATQLFHAPSSVTLESHDEQLCLGDSAQFAVRVAGSGPWTLTYQLASKSVRTQQVLDNIRDAHYKFMTPPLNESGLHYVELQSVRDANGCTTELKIPGAKVEVYQQRPSASFYSEEFKTADEKDDAIALKMIGGQYTQIPVHFSGHPPFTVGVEFSEDTDGAWRPLAPFTSDSAKGHIRTAKPGTYRLTTIRDHVCTGSVSSPSRARLSTIPQPTVSISRVQGKSLSEFKQMPAEATAICQDEKASVGLTLSGKPPYAVRYRVDYDPCPTTIFKGSSCRVLSEARTFNLAQNAPLLELETAQAGAYVYTLQSVSDDHYSDLPLDDGERSFSLRIHSRPNIQARVASGPTHLCVNSALPKSRGVHLELDGAAPWTVHYDVTHDAGPVQGTVSSTEQTIRRSSVEFQSASVDFVPEDIALTDVGRYRLRLRNITDGNGCHRTLTEEQASQPVLEVIVSAQPDLALLGVVSGGVLRPDERSLSCVGDTIELVVQGIPPFRMDYVYEVNGTVQEHSMNLDGAGVTGGGGLFRDIRLFDHQQRREAGQASGNGVIAKKVRLRLIDEGVVRFRRICHGQSMDGSAGDGAHWCCKELTGVEHFVYGLPSARINAGRHGTDVIREGNEAVMSVEFRGHPPFMFTYVRRSEHGVELDSHTVTDIKETTYTLKIAQAGTFKVTSIGDQYCRFPRQANAKRRAVSS